MPIPENKKLLDFGNGGDLFIPSATATLSLVIGVVFFDPASPKDFMWDFNNDQRSFDKKSRLFLVHFGVSQ